MPRPLIIKVESHKSQPNKKATGSINVQLLKGIKKTNLYESYNFENDNVASIIDDEQPNPPEESGSKSIVRNLISRYETSPDKANLIKYKSKSMADLQKPQISIATKTTQDDFLYNRNKYSNDESENEKFDFKKVFLKFETSTSSHVDKKTTTSSNQSINRVKNYKSNHYNHHWPHLSDVKRKAKMLLQNYDQHGYDFSLWQHQVVELLQEIEHLSDSTEVKVNQGWNSSSVNKIEEKAPNVVYKEENILKRAKSLDSGEFNKNLKVRDIKNIFEAKPDYSKPLSRSVSTYATYFGLKPLDEGNTSFTKKFYNDHDVSSKNFNGNYKNNQLEHETSEDSDIQEEDSYEVEYEPNRAISSDAIEGNRIITQPVLESSVKIRELKSLFETQPDKYVPYNDYVHNGNEDIEKIDTSGNFSDSSGSTETGDIHVVENRMLPPPKIVLLDDQADGKVDDVENTKQQIEELTKNIEDYEHKIANLSEENKDEGSYINEVLVKILIKLDDIKTYGDEVILTERRKAIQFVQSCIMKLKNKIHGTE